MFQCFTCVLYVCVENLSVPLHQFQQRITSAGISQYVTASTLDYLFYLMILAMSFTPDTCASITKQPPCSAVMRCHIVYWIYRTSSQLITSFSLRPVHYNYISVLLPLKCIKQPKTFILIIVVDFLFFSDDLFMYDFISQVYVDNRHICYPNETEREI